MLPASIIKECNRFLADTPAPPLYRWLPAGGEGFRKVKIRKNQRHALELEQYMDMAFGGQYKDLRLRSVVGHTAPPVSDNPMTELFYIFPIDGYRVLFNPQIENYAAYITMLETAIHGSATGVQDLMKTLFQYVFTAGTVRDASVLGVDVLIYNIPYYYAIRKSLVDDYSDLLSV